MARVNVIADDRPLTELIQSFYQNKSELDGYKKICEDENAKIKAKMTEINADSYETDGLIAKLTYKDKSTFNEIKLLATIKSLGLDVIKTKEYVDMDSLEKVLYSGTLTAEAKQKLLDCKEPKTEISLKVTRKKEKK